MEVIAIFLACLVLPAMGAQSWDPRIIGTTDADYVDIQDYPYMLSLRYQGNHVCGAAAIGLTWAITSAECIPNGLTCLTVHSDHASLAGRSTSHPVTGATIHPNYDDVTHAFNVAVLKVSVPFRAENVIRVANLDPEPLSEAIFTGWGTQSEDFDDANPFLTRSSMTIIGLRTCQADYAPEGRPITDDMLCASGSNVSEEYNKDPCVGDWGGPLMAKESGLPALVGVSSFAVGCGRINLPSVFVQVTYPTIRLWITNTAGV